MTTTAELNYIKKQLGDVKTAFAVQATEAKHTRQMMKDFKEILSTHMKNEEASIATLAKSFETYAEKTDKDVDDVKIEHAAFKGEVIGAFKGVRWAVGISLSIATIVGSIAGYFGFTGQS